MADEIKEMCTFWRRAEFERLGSAELKARQFKHRLFPLPRDEYLYPGTPIPRRSAQGNCIFLCVFTTDFCRFNLAVFADRKNANAVASLEMIGY
jgi:hypothetical protein